MNNFLDFNVTRNFPNNLDNLFNDDFVVDDLLFVSWHFDKFIHNFFHDFLNFDIDILFNFNFDDSVLDHGNLNNSFHLFYFLFNNNFWDDSFHNLRNFYNFFDNSGHNDNFLNYFLYFNNLWHFNHFLDNFFDWNSYFLDSINISDNLYNLFLDIFDRFGDINVMIDDSLDLNSFRLFDDNRVSKVDLFDDCIFDFLDHWLLDNLLNSHDSFMDDWNLYYSLDLFWHFFDHLHNDLHLSNHLFNNLLNSYFLHNSLHFSNLLDNALHDHHFLYYLWYFHDPFDSLDDRNWLFNDSVNYFISNFNMVIDLLSCNHLFLWNYHFDYLFYFNHLWYLNNSLYNFLNDDRDLLDNLNNSLGGYDFLDNDFKGFNFGFNVIDNFLDFHDLFNLNLSFDNSFHNFYFWNLSYHLNYSLYNVWYLDNSLNYSFDRNYFFNNVWNNCWNL